MKFIWRAFLVLAVVLLGFWACQKLFPGDEQKIRKLLRGVAGSLTFKAGEGNLKKLATVNTLGAYFSPDVTLDLNIPGGTAKTIEGRDELIQLVLAARSTLSGAKVEILGVTVQLGPAPETAAAHLMAKATINGEKDFDLQELTLSLKQTKAGWVIARVETVRTLGL